MSGLVGQGKEVEVCLSRIGRGRPIPGDAFNEWREDWGPSRYSVGGVP